MVLPFSALALLAVAFLACARHATDGGDISRCQGRLAVMQAVAGRRHRVEFAGHAVRVEEPPDARRLVRLQGGGRVVEVGRYIRPDLRKELARELRWALRCAWGPLWVFPERTVEGILF